MSDEAQGARSFWTSMPGILAGIAAVIVAVTGLITFLLTRPGSGPTPGPTLPASPGVPAILLPTSGSTLRVNEAVVSGRADPGATVTVTEAGQGLGTAVADAQGGWKMTVNMRDGRHTLVAKAVANGISSPSATTVFTVDTRRPVSLFDKIPKPEYRVDRSVEIGLKFSTSVDGTLTGLRFYKAPTDRSSKHSGSVWNEGGTQLARLEFTLDPNSSGWQTATFPTPVSIIAGQKYIVSYFTETGAYVRTVNYFAEPHVVSPLTAHSGVYKYNARSTFPTTAYLANYWVDVVFLAKLGA